MEIDARDLRLEYEGLATFLGFDLDERAVTVQRLAQGVMRRREDCTGLALALPHLQCVAEALELVRRIALAKHVGRERWPPPS